MKLLDFMPLHGWSTIRIILPISVYHMTLFSYKFIDGTDDINLHTYFDLEK